MTPGHVIAAAGVLLVNLFVGKCSRECVNSGTDYWNGGMVDLNFKIQNQIYIQIRYQSHQFTYGDLDNQYSTVKTCDDQ